MGGDSPELIALNARIAELGNDALHDESIAAKFKELSGEDFSKSQLKRILKYAKQGGKKEKKAPAFKEQAAKTQGQGKNEKVAEQRRKEQLENKYVNRTKSGEYKVDLAEPISKDYNPEAVESAWYDWWEKEGLFKPDDTDKEKPTFVIMIPPPNVTGSLHIGHALTCAIQDCVVRWKRMQGFNTLWVPGTDHAGIATQVVVEKKLQAEQGLTRHDIGREAFLEMVWKWKAEKGSHITKQLRLTGASVDWDREAFTMDEQLSRAVTESFVRMSDKGLIYRDVKLVNWCPTLKSVISDLEVDNVDISPNELVKVPGYDKPVLFGFMFHFAYKVHNGDGELVVATTRPETMLGDTGVAIHPEDPRYQHLHGKSLVHPFTDRIIPVILDSVLVDMTTGTGAVKITPAHDPNDYQSGLRHGLEQINILTDDGEMNCSWGANPAGKQFEGMKRYDARTAVMEALKELGLSRAMEGHSMVIPRCSRTKDVLESMLKPQWFQDCKDMAARAVQAVKDGELNIVPKSHVSTWNHWLCNIQDWCISRQLWWGHRIPAWFVDFKGEAPGDMATETARWVVARSEEEALAKAAKQFNRAAADISLTRDPDVLDTWYSSGLFPFSTLGWPDTEASDFQMYYPGALLETGYDILFFWVARMVMMGLELTDKLPFRDVFLHTLVRDKYGRKMSKSLGNVLDPLWVVFGAELNELHASVRSGNLPAAEVEKACAAQTDQFPSGIAPCGSDGLRFALLFNTKMGSDVNLDINVVVTFRQFGQKIWQVSKFMLSHLEGFTPAATPFEGIEMAALPLLCKWAISRLDSVVQATNEHLTAYSFADAAVVPYKFFMDEFCAVFVEHVKSALQPGTPEAQLTAVKETLYTLIDTQLRLLHPFMPFVTEELWQRLPRRAAQPARSIMIAEYPAAAGWQDDATELEFNLILEVVNALRSIKGDYNIKFKDSPPSYARSSDPATHALLQRYVSNISAVAGVTLQCLEAAEEPPPCASRAVGTLSIYMDISGLCDMGDEIAKKEKTIAQKKQQLHKVVSQMADPNFLKKPEAKREADAKKRTDLEKEITQLEVDLAAVLALTGGAAAEGGAAGFGSWYATKCAAK